MQALALRQLTKVYKNGIKALKGIDLEVAEGKITGKEGDKFTAGRLGQYTVGAKGEVVLGPAQIVTPANVDEFKF